MRWRKNSTSHRTDVLRQLVWSCWLASLAGGVLAADATERLGIAVMDPLAKPLACECVAGYAQRDYDALAKHLGAKLDRPVSVRYLESIASLLAADRTAVDVIVGKFSVVRHDAMRAGATVRSVALLSGEDGEVSQSGLFVVRARDPARYAGDLTGRRILFGTAESNEKHAAALVSLEAFAVPVPATGALLERESCGTAALAVVEGEADAAVVSSYAMPLLQGCGTIAKDELKIIGHTDAVPFIGVFLLAHVSTDFDPVLTEALAAANADADLLIALESQSGFVSLPEINDAGWTDWRDAGRVAIRPDVPSTLPPRKRLLWSRTMTGPGMAGLAVAEDCLVVADKDLDETQDIFRCLDADTGDERWRIAYPAAGDMDFTNSPRATPVIHEDLVYLLGAFGDLHCLRLSSGEVVWRRQLAEDFDARRPQWGYSSTPLIVDDKLIVNPGAKTASLVALDRRTGEVLWRTPGDAPGYASLLRAKLGGKDQIVGYDVASLGGWDPVTGRRLWRLKPEIQGDFNVPTPIVMDGNLLVATENNGTRLYGFNAEGQIEPQPLAANQDLAPDTSTPLLLDGMLLGAFGGLTCLDATKGLRTCWESEEDGLTDYCSLIGGRGHVLVMSQSGKLVLIKAERAACRVVDDLDLFADVTDTDREVWSHPALVGNRLYVRNLLGVYCFLLN